MVARNRCFRIAALLLALAYLFPAANFFISSIHLLHRLNTGEGIAIVLNCVSSLVVAGGWAAVAGALGEEIDWRRLRSGAAVVITGFFMTYVALVTRIVAGNDHDHNVHKYLIWNSIGGLLLAAAALVVASGFVDSKRGSARGVRLQIGTAVAAASAGGFCVSELYLQLYWSSMHFAHGLLIGAVAVAFRQASLALAGLAFALGSRWPLARREAQLTAAAVGAAVASLCVGGGNVSIAISVASQGAPGWQAAATWLEVGFGVTGVVAFAFVALGAREAAASADEPVGAPQ